MAAVTVATGWPKHLVNANAHEWMYKVTIAADADYLDVPLHDVWCVNVNDDGVSAVGVAGVTRVGEFSRIEFNSGGALNNVRVRVIGQ